MMEMGSRGLSARIALVAVLFLGFGCSFFGNSKVREERLTLLGLAGAEGLPNEPVTVGSAKIGPAGGALISQDKQFQLFVPPGALDSELELKVQRYPQTSTALPKGYVATGNIYEVQPPVRFKKTAQVTVVLDTGTIQTLSLQKNKSLGFIAAENRTEEFFTDNTWTASSSQVLGDRVLLNVNAASFFALGSPPEGNLAPVISGVTYYFKPGLRWVPYKVRAKVVEPEGDAFDVFFLGGWKNTRMFATPMQREGTSDYFTANITPEVYTKAAYTNSGTSPKFQVIAEDSGKNYSTVPASGPFRYPADQGTLPSPGFSPDADGDNWVDLWEINNGYDPNNASSPPASPAIPDSDFDGIGDYQDSITQGDESRIVRTLPAKPVVGVGKTFALGIYMQKNGVPVYPTVLPDPEEFIYYGFRDGGYTLINEDELSIFRANYEGKVLLQWGASVNDSQAYTDISVLGAQVIRSSEKFSNFTVQKKTTRSFTFSYWISSDLSNQLVSTFSGAPVIDVRYSTSPILDDRACDNASSLQIIDQSVTVYNPSNPSTIRYAPTLTLSQLGIPLGSTIYLCTRFTQNQVSRTIWDTTANVSYQIPAALDITPPNPVSGISGIALSPYSIQLNWLASGDDGNIGAASNYYIRGSSNEFVGQNLTEEQKCNQRSVAKLVSSATSPAGTPMSTVITPPGGLMGYTVYHYCIFATDEEGNISSFSGTVSVTTPAANLPPIVSFAKAVLEVPKNQPAFLDATPSSDPDGPFCGTNPNSYVYTWVFDQKPSGSALTNSNIQNANTLTPNFTPDVDGTYVLKFTYADPGGSCYGGTISVDGFVTVNAHANIYQEAYIKRDIFGSEGYFGYSIARSGDYLAVGSPGDESNQTTITNASYSNSNQSMTQSGAVFIFRKLPSGWVQEAYIKPSNAASNGFFGGYSIDLEGDLLAVGSDREKSNSTTIINGTMSAPTQNVSSNIGAVYLYRRKSTGWEQEAYIKAPNATQITDNVDSFGRVLDLEGGTLFVGAPDEDGLQSTISTGVVGTNSSPSNVAVGAVYSYVKDVSGWRFDTFFKASNNVSTTSFRQFGASLKACGNRLVVGDNGEDSAQNTITNGSTAPFDRDASFSGAVFVYRKDPGGWVQEAFIKPPNTNAGDRFGMSVDFDCNRIAVLSTYESNSFFGIINGTAIPDDENSSVGNSIYTFTRSGTSWTFESYMRPPRSVVENQYVEGIPLRLNGNYLAFGNSYDRSPVNSILYGQSIPSGFGPSTSGAVYLYKLKTGIGWTEEAYIKPSNSGQSNYFGYGLYFQGDSLIIGAKGEPSVYSGIINGPGVATDRVGYGKGAVYVYKVE